MLSVTADHALRAILALAREPGRAPVRATVIADAIGAPRNYLAKTLNLLAKAGVIASGRGPTGGFALAVAPESITVADIVALFDTPRPTTRCLLGNAECDPRHACAAHERWTDLMNAGRDSLATTTIADLLRGRAAPSTAVA